MEHTARNQNPNRTTGRPSRSPNLKVVPFDKWKTDKLESAFGIRFQELAPSLTQWTAARHPVPESRKEFLETLRKELMRSRNFWNEIELRTRFIGPVLELVGFTGKGYNAFAGRPLSAIIGEFKIEGKPDWMVATGESEPENPYFFLHEYKQIHVGSPDPQGQVLAAMIAAQALNHDGRPVYGCYTVAQYWSFVLLDGPTYSVSQGYDATDKDEILIVWSILQETKIRIERLVAQAVPQT